MATAVNAGIPDFDPDLQEQQFREHLLNYLVVLACKYIGDDVAYVRYMQKQAASQNEHAIAGVNALNFIDKIHKIIDRNVQFFAATGHARVVLVCNTVRQLESPPTCTSDLWHLCALTGVNTQHALLLSASEHNVLAIDAQFKAFATMLWLVTHIDAVEYNRTMQFVNAMPAEQSITASIDCYKQHLQEHSDELVNLYFHATTYVLQCLQMTRQRLQCSAQ